MQISGSVWCSFLQNCSKTYLVLKHIDINLRHPHIWIMCMSCKEFSSACISATVMLVIAPKSSGRYVLMLTIQVLSPWCILLVVIVAPPTDQINLNKLPCLGFQFWWRVFHTEPLWNCPRRSLVGEPRHGRSSQDLLQSPVSSSDDCWLSAVSRWCSSARIFLTGVSSSQCVSGGGQAWWGGEGAWIAVVPSTGT